MIAIVDYGMGNLRSVEKAFASLGFEAAVTSDATQVLSASHVVLPGVGAFAQAIGRLRETGLDKAILDVAKRGTPLLGICLGMQLMFEKSLEGGRHEGLKLFSGTVERLPETGLKIPHMGWNTLETRSCPLFDGAQNPCVYFVHSYAVMTVSDDYTAAVCTYGDAFTAAVCKNNVMATQFHPEKSGDAGLLMLKRFAQYEGEVKPC